MRRRKRNKRYARISVFVAFGCLLLFSVGYAAFNTNINLNAKGNIKHKKASDFLKSKLVSEGDGLYINTYEDGRYIYR